MITSVGHGPRTQGKHALLDSIVGREAGMMANPKARAHRLSFMVPFYTMLDLTAGDGLPTNSSEETSPMILCRHRERVHHAGVGCKVFLCERDKATFARLERQSGLAAHFVFGDARKTVTSLDSFAKPRTPIFIHADPNHVRDWPLSPSLLESLRRREWDQAEKRPTDRWYWTMLITMGFNVSGMKRLPVEARRPWEERIKELTDHLPYRHDALLVTLVNDPAQWAYLIVGPKCWGQAYRDDAQRAFCYWENGIEIISFREEETAFWQRVRELVYTKEELKEELTDHAQL